VGLLGCTAGEQIDKRSKGQASLIEHADRSANRSVFGQRNARPNSGPMPPVFDA
jgi:hypothetical protein